MVYKVTLKAFQSTVNVTCLSRLTFPGHLTDTMAIILKCHLGLAKIGLLDIALL